MPQLHLLTNHLTMSQYSRRSERNVQFCRSIHGLLVKPSAGASMAGGAVTVHYPFLSLLKVVDFYVFVCSGLTFRFEFQDIKLGLTFQRTPFLYNIVS